MRQFEKGLFAVCTIMSPIQNLILFFFWIQLSGKQHTVLVMAKYISMSREWGLFLSLLFSHFLHCCAACWSSKRTRDVSPRPCFPQPRWIKICHQRCPSRLLGASQQELPGAALSPSWEMILIKNRINKLWARLLSQSLEPFILISEAKFIHDVTAAS